MILEGPNLYLPKAMSRMEAGSPTPIHVSGVPIIGPISELHT